LRRKLSQRLTDVHVPSPLPGRLVNARVSIRQQGKRQAECVFSSAAEVGYVWLWLKHDAIEPLARCPRLTIDKLKVPSGVF
jgi:hypothetical protein